MVLRPVRGETTRLARDRTLGTRLGAVASVVIVLILPTSLSLVLAGMSGLLMVAWALANDDVRMTFFGTPAVILLSSSGVVGAIVAVAANRLVLTVIGAVVALTLAVLLARWEDAHPTTR